MTQDPNNRNQLLELVTAYADGEATLKEEAVVEAVIANDLFIKKRLDSEYQIKKLIREKCSRVKAPEHLKHSIDQTLTDMGSATTGSASLFSRTVYMAAALIVFAAALIQIYNYFTVQNTVYEVELLAEKHFRGSQITGYLPVGEQTTASAIRYLRDHHNMNIVVPELKGARFAGVTLIEFVDGYQTPLLAYTATHDTDFIYIFAFDIPQMQDETKLTRDEDAVSSCSGNPDYFHIKDINGKHVISWQWESTWYAAVSDHDGQLIAGMLPRQNTPTD